MKTDDDIYTPSTKINTECNVANVNKLRQGEGFYSQTNLPGLIPRTPREKLLNL